MCIGTPEREAPQTLRYKHLKAPWEKGSFLYSGAVLWNNLPANIKSIASTSSLRQS